MNPALDDTTNDTGAGLDVQAQPDLHETTYDTLTRDDYCSPDVYAREQRLIFHAGWFYACHADSLPAGHRRVVDVAGESVIVARDTDGALYAHANVCRHRGAQLCDPSPAGEAARGAIRCGYHAWTYGLDGSLRATPRVEDDLDRAQLALWGRHAAEWNGMVFVSVAVRPEPLEDWLRRHTPWLFTFSELPIGSYKVGARTVSEVKANWKILLENYQECLHCAVVHPELVDLIPLYRTGHVVDPERTDGAVKLVDGADTFVLGGKSDLSPLPGVTPETIDVYRGCGVFPNVMFDVTGTSASLTALYPIGPDTTVVVAEYLFGADDVAKDGFDPTEVVNFNELVGRQDFDVCERVQRGVSSPSFTHGVLTAKDSLVIDFVRQYRDTLSAVT